MTGQLIAGSMDHVDQASLVRSADSAQGGPGARPASHRGVLFLISDTGGGHRRAAEAVIEALTAKYGTSVRPVVCDPLAGPDAPRTLRWLAGLYGPAIRWAPWAWGAAYHVTNSGLAMAVLARTLFAPAQGPVATAARACQPAVIVSCHPLTGRAALRAAMAHGLDGRVGQDGRRLPAGIPVITVVTDLARVHASWLSPAGARIAVSSSVARARCERAGIPPGRCIESGLPVSAGGLRGSPSRESLRESLGVPAGAFVVLVAGGGEGCGGVVRQTRAILRQFSGVHVVTMCGRNTRARRHLTRWRLRSAGRLTVLGFVDNSGDWLRVADVVVTKAGPGIIAEAACARVPLVLTSHVPGQERGNAALVVQAGAGCAVRGTRGAQRALASLTDSPVALASMREAGARLARPDAAAVVADLIAAEAGLAGRRPERVRS
jgi:1,2-diacylglycerol 3-beta-galactosyltransferase